MLENPIVSPVSFLSFKSFCAEGPLSTRATAARSTRSACRLVRSHPRVEQPQKRAASTRREPEPAQLAAQRDELLPCSSVSRPYATCVHRSVSPQRMIR